MTGEDLQVLRQLIREVVREELAPKRAAELLTLAEAAAELRCSKSTVQRLLRRRKLRAARNADAGSSRVLIPRSEIARYVRALTA